MDRTLHPRRRLLFHLFLLLFLKFNLLSTDANVTSASSVNVSTHSNVRTTRTFTVHHITIIEFGAVGAVVDLYVNGRFTQRSLPSRTSQVTTMLPATSTVALRVFGHGTGALYVTVRGRGNLLSSSTPQLFHAIAESATPVSAAAWPTASYDAVACSWPLARSASLGSGTMIPNIAPLWANRAHAGQTVLVRNVARGCGSSASSATPTSATATTTTEDGTAEETANYKGVNNDVMEDMHFDMKAKPEDNAVALAAGFVRRLRKVLYATDRTMGVQMIALTGVQSIQSKRAILLKSSLLNSQPLLRQGVNATQRYVSTGSTTTATGVKTDCFAEKCGTEVEVISEAVLRRQIITTAVNRLRLRASFDDVYDLDEVLVTKEVEQFIYAVFVPFRQLYISEFRR